jgi:hypothetical protein
MSWAPYCHEADVARVQRAAKDKIRYAEKDRSLSAETSHGPSQGVWRASNNQRTLTAVACADNRIATMNYNLRHRRFT